ncbi:MAG: photosystem I reaction center subunit XII [Moorea sp. SIO4G2]|nr:photosystem I reaction center subunit XII [Moorena sp. SIO4G2]
MGNLARSATLGLDAFEGNPLEMRPNQTEEDLQIIIRAVYKQVLGNEHLMEEQRLESAEALLRDDDITVRQFVRIIAQSNLYKSLFFHSSSPYRFIELNFKHLLGRAPQSQQEIQDHVQIYYEQGYDAEIDSYIDSEEYILNFGEYIVPYPRNIRSQVGLNNESFNRMFSLLRGSPTSDRNNSAQLITSVASNMATPIEPLAMGNGANYDNTGKRFKITYSSSNDFARAQKVSKQQITVSFDCMSKAFQNIHEVGGKILSITEAL